MAIKFTCSQCGKQLSAPESAIGKKGKCSCGAIIEVPPRSTVPEPQEEILDAEVVPAAEPNPLDAMGDTYDVAPDPTPAAPVSNEPRKPCPMCGEMIPANAVKCRFCGEIFDPALKAAEKKKGAAGSGDEDLTTVEWVVALLCSGIGCICGIVWMIQGKPKGKKMFFVSLGMVIFWNVVTSLLRR